MLGGLQREGAEFVDFDEFRTIKGKAWVKSSCLFVTGLPVDSMNDIKLRDHFSIFGNVVRAQMVRAPDGRPVGSGVVCFRHADEAYEAKRGTLGVIMAGRTLRVSYLRKGNLLNKADPEVNLTRVFVSNFPRELTKKMMEEFTAENDIVPELMFFPAYNTKFCFLQYKTKQEAANAKEKMDTALLEGTQLYHAFQKGKHRKGKTRAIRIGNVDPTKTPEQLRNEFREKLESYGPVENVVIRPANSHSYAKMIVCFSEQESADNAMEAFNSESFNGRDLETIYVFPPAPMDGCVDEPTNQLCIRDIPKTENPNLQRNHLYDNLNEIVKILAVSVRNRMLPDGEYERYALVHCRTEEDAKQIKDAVVEIFEKKADIRFFLPLEVEEVSCSPGSFSSVHLLPGKRPIG